MLPETLPLTFGAVPPESLDMNRIHKGAASELRAAAHLIGQGFHVFRCVAPHAPFDLVAHRDGHLLRVEVKSVSNPSRKSYFPVFGWPTNDEWDLLVICSDEAIFQFPAGTTRDEARAELAKVFKVASREPAAAPRSTPPRIAQPSLEQRIMAVFEEFPERWGVRLMRSQLETQGWTTQAFHKTSAVADAMRRLDVRGLLRRTQSGEYEQVTLRSIGE